MVGTGPVPAAGIPILPRDQYAAYLRVTGIAGGLMIRDHFTLSFEIWNFDHTTHSFTLGETCSAVMYWKTAPAGYPSPANYLEGEVTNAAGTSIGKLCMGRVSEYLRKAEVEIDRVNGLNAPLDNGAGKVWADIFREAGWDVSVRISNANLADEADGTWSEADLHRTMLLHREAVSLDDSWHYYSLCVPHSTDSGLWGVMFDAYGSDSNHIPREGAGVFARSWFPNDAKYGRVRNQTLDATICYFRTAVHELGHALLLFHPAETAGNYILQRTAVIAQHAQDAGVLFPDNVIWSFSPDDQRLLRHLPDPAVRPGGEIRFGEDAVPGYATMPLPPTDLARTCELTLAVAPLLETIPLGAPVRVDLKLANTSPEALTIPAQLSLKNGMLSGQVIDALGTVRGFSPIVRRIETEPYGTLEPGENKTASLTLLRGSDGALFPGQGVYRIVVKLAWMMDDYPVYVEGETSVMVTPASNETHAQNALRLLTEPDTLLVLAIGGDHVQEGIQAIQSVLSDPVLGPHYAYIEAKRQAEFTGKRKTNLKAAAELICDNTVMSAAEIDKMARLVQAAPADNQPAKAIAQVLKRKVRSARVDDQLKNRVDSL